MRATFELNLSSTPSVGLVQLTLFMMTKSGDTRPWSWAGENLGGHFLLASRKQEGKGKALACFAFNGRKEAQTGWKVIRSHYPTRGNSNFHEHLNDNISS